ncbi:MAG: hypothetical protein ABJF01_25320 [bacterium]
MRNPQSSRDREVAELLKKADRGSASTPAQLSALSGRIRAAAAPILREHEARNRTVWDYAERWAGTLLPLGMLTAVAAAMCLFALSMQRDPELVPEPVPVVARVTTPPPGTRTAILGAVTNRVSSQNLVDLVVSVDAPSPAARVPR